MKVWLEKNKERILIALFIAGVLSYFSGLNSLLPLQEDSGLYITLANSLAKGLGFVSTTGPVSYPSNHYPFVYPAILSPLVYLFPGNFFVLKLLNIFLTLLLIVCIFYMLPKFFKGNLVIVAVVLIVLNPQISFYSRQILSEITYTFFSIITLYFLMRYQEESPVINPYLFVSIFVFFLTYYTRLIGISIFVSLIIVFFLKKMFKKGIIVFSLFSLVIAPWVVRNFMIGRSEYMSEFIGSTSNVVSLMVIA